LTSLPGSPFRPRSQPLHLHPKAVPSFAFRVARGTLLNSLDLRKDLMAFYESNGRRNYFIEFGAGRPVVLLHGISNSGRAWGPQIAPLVRAGFHVIVPDHAGHGASRPITRRIGVADIASDLLALLDQLQLDTTDLVGLSLGGMVALLVALDHPERVRRLVVANSFDSWIGDELRAMAEGWATIFRNENGPVNRLERTWPMLVNKEFQSSDEGLRTYQIWHGIAATANGASLAHVSEGLSGFDVRESLSRLAPPTLFIAGEHDRMSLPAVGQRMAASSAKASYAELSGASHISNVDSPDLFNQTFIPFLLAGESGA
jgi:3-oxoadipate enol-lactonase